jgi:hypothetical protein
MMNESAPPSSSVLSLRFLPAVAPAAVPVCSLPVRATPRTSERARMCSVALIGANRSQNMPSGRSASSKGFCITGAEVGTSSTCFKTIAFPARICAAATRTTWTYGKFHRSIAR